MKKFLPLLICGMLITSSASAEIKTYEGVGEYVMSDFETPDVAKQRAKQRAEAAAQEQAGVFVRSNTKVANLELKSEEIEVITAGIMKVHSVTYDVRPDTAGFVFTSKVLVDIDTDEIDKWLEMNKDSKNDLIEQNKSLQASLAEQEKQLAELKSKLATLEQNQEIHSSPELRMQMTRDFAKSDNAFLANQRLKEGIAAHNSGNLRGAIKAYSESIELNENNSAAYTWRGNAYGSLNEFQRAENDLTRAIQLNNRNFDAYLGLGIVYYYTKNYEAAISALNYAIQINNTNGKAYYTRGLCYQYLGRKFEALKDFSTAQILNYNN